MKKSYTIRITSNNGEVNLTRTLQSVGLPRVIQHAHSMIDNAWYDLDVFVTGHLTITNDHTGETCWESTITPYEE